MTLGAKVAEPYLQDIPKAAENEPGQFGFAHKEFVEGILAQSGWQNVRIAPVDVPCRMSIDHFNQYIEKLGPAGLIIPKLTENEKATLLNDMRKAFTPFIDGDDVTFMAACWSIAATA